CRHLNTASIREMSHVDHSRLPLNRTVDCPTLLRLQSVASPLIGKSVFRQLFCLTFFSPDFFSENTHSFLGTEFVHYRRSSAFGWLPLLPSLLAFEAPTHSTSFRTGNACVQPISVSRRPTT